MKTAIRASWSFALLAYLVACGSGTTNTPSRAKAGKGGAGAGGAATATAGASGITGDASGGTPANALKYDGLNGIAKNPIIRHAFTADPSAHLFEGRIYLYASHDLDDQTGYNMKDYHVYSSADLVNWQDHGVAFEAKSTQWATLLYAPDCAYSPVTGKYYLYFPNGGANIGVAVSEHPAGPFVDALGGPLITNKTPGVEDVDWVFDPACFVDDDGQAYLYFGGGMPGTGDNARVIRLGADMVSLADAAATTISAPDFFEASYMHKRNGKYYFSYSTTTASHSATIDYMISDNPMTGFVYAGTLLPNPNYNYDQNNHHSVVQVGDDWYVFYHTRALAHQLGIASGYQRSVTLDHLTYNADGTVVTMPKVTGKVAQLRTLDAASRLEAETIGDERGIETGFAEDAGARVGVMVTDIHNEDWVGYSQVDFADGATSFHARVASGSAVGGTINLYVDGCDMFTTLPGVRIGSCQVSPTGGWQIWADVDCAIEPTLGVHDLYLRFSGAGTDPLLDIDYFRFE